MKSEKRKVQVTIQVGDQKKDFTRDYEAQIFENAEDIIGVMQSEDGLKSILASLNYGHDLKAKAKVRQVLLRENSVSVDATLAKAMKTIQDARKAAGKEPLSNEKLMDRAKAMLAVASDD
jgi:hypothetical protein